MDGRHGRRDTHTHISVVSFSQRLYPYCSVLVVSRNGIEIANHQNRTLTNNIGRTLDMFVSL